MRSDFIFDFIPLIPFPYILNLQGKEVHLFVIKIMRLVNGFRIFNVYHIMQGIKKFQQNRLNKIIETDPMKAEDTISDQNKVTQMIMTKFFIRIFKLSLIIVHICYFLGLFWFIFCEIAVDFTEENLNSLSGEELELANTENFIEYFELEDSSEMRKSIVGLYFAFTTLSTVGFGDYTPRSNTERCMGSFILISGVAMFSFLMGNYIDILGTYTTLNADLDDGDTLANFFGMLVHFNKEKAIEFKLKREIEEHFDYRWKHDRNQAITSDEDVSHFEQLPDGVQDKLYREFLFISFFSNFTYSYFNIPKNVSGLKVYYTWDDQSYRDFMINLVRKLEPRYEVTGTIIYKTVEEVEEIFFIDKGSIDIGFEINN
jgi:hypothetical protein